MRRGASGGAQFVVSAAKPAGAKDKRRSRRFPCVLHVDVHTKNGSRALQSVNISRHGLFLASDEPLRERHVVQLTIQLPDQAPVEATAWVSRSVAPGNGAVAGAGIQLFTLSADAKNRWDRFFFDLRESQLSGPTPPAQGPQTPSFPQVAEDAASFVVKFKSIDRLHEFDDNSLDVGGTFLVTPVLRPIGTEVQMIMVHPETDEEFVLTGQIVRLNEATPKGIEIKFHDDTNRRRTAFRRFVETGHHLPESPDAAWDAMGLELAGGVARPEPHPGAMEEHSVPSGPVVAAPGPDAAEGKPSLDVVVGQPLKDEERFDWDKVDQNFMIDLDIENQVLVDFEITDDNASDLVVEEAEEVAPVVAKTGKAQPPSPAPLTSLPGPADEEAIAEEARLFAREATSDEAEFVDDGDVEIDSSQDEVLPPADPLAEALMTAGLESIAVRVMCSDCDFDTTLTLGDAPGALGLVATLKPFWSPREDTMLAVARARGEDEVALILDAVEDVTPGTFSAPVPMRVVLDAAALARKPRDPESGEELHEIDATTAVSAAVERLRDAEKFVDLDAPCHICDGAWTVVKR